MSRNRRSAKLQFGPIGSAGIPAGEFLHPHPEDGPAGMPALPVRGIGTMKRHDELLLHMQQKVALGKRRFMGEPAV